MQSARTHKLTLKDIFEHWKNGDIYKQYDKKTETTQKLSLFFNRDKMYNKNRNINLINNHIPLNITNYFCDKSYRIKLI